MDDISKKILEVYPGIIVRKDLSGLLKRSVNVPSFVLEYLLGIYCSTEDENALANGLKKVQKILSENFVNPNDNELIKFKIRDNGRYTIIDKLKARLSNDGSIYIGEFSNLKLSSIKVSEEMIRKNKKILGEGIWVMAKVAFKNVSVETDLEQLFKESIDDKYLKEKNEFDDFNYNNRSKRKTITVSKDIRETITNPFVIETIKPIQMPTFDIEDFISKRNLFTTQEWIELLIRSIGIDPTGLNDKERLHILERLVPMIESNYNLVELGPRGTGKSYAYKEISPYTILISGGYASASTLFYNVSRNIPGLVSSWDVVAFDEVAGMQLKSLDGIQIMKDFMASGSFVRGRKGVNAGCSLVFVGNINDTVQNLIKTSTLFEPFPKEINMDSAFFDRVHYYLPGWEVPKIRSGMITSEYGLINDAISEFFTLMRTKDFSHILDGDFKFNASLNIRDEIGIRKTISGLMKLIFPNREYTADEAEIIVKYAIEGRRRVKEQLKKMSGEEFADVNLGYYKKGGSLTIVNVPERMDETLITSEPLPVGHVYSAGSVNNRFVSLFKIETRVEFLDRAFKDSKFIKEVISNSKLTHVTNVENSWVAFKNYIKDHGLDLYDREVYCTIRDILRKGVSNSIAVGEFISIFSAYFKKEVKPSAVFAGNISLSGVIEDFKDVSDYIRIANNAGATYLIIPENAKAEVSDLKSSIANQVQILYFDSIDSLLKVAFEK